MHVKVQHETLYRYDVPIALGPHVLRLSPRTGVRTASLFVEPTPVQQWRELDALGNSLTHLGFQGETRRFRVQSRFEVDTWLPNTPSVQSWRLPRGLALASDGSTTGIAIASSVREFAEAIALEQAQRPLEFLDALARALHQRIQGNPRLGGDARPAAETLGTGSGACRDVATLFLEACRSVGLSARFVSGYHAYLGQLSQQADLHAWAEVELPDTGFVGWDPTLGTRVGEGHIAVCAGATQAATQAIEGNYTFQGTELNSTLDFSLQVDAR